MRRPSTECARPLRHQHPCDCTRTSQCRSCRQCERRYGQRPCNARSILCSWQTNSLIVIQPHSPFALPAQPMSPSRRRRRGTARPAMRRLLHPCGLASCLTPTSSSPFHRSTGASPPPTYKSGFTQDVNFSRAIDIWTDDRAGRRWPFRRTCAAREQAWSERRSARRGTHRCARRRSDDADMPVRAQGRAQVRAGRRRTLQPSRSFAPSGEAVGDAVGDGSAPGGNRTRGLRLERPLLFGSPKRTVDH
jgi:hypothetical protein